MKLLEVKGLKVIERRTNRVLLKGIDFFIQKGEILGVLGESGSGKSLTGLSIVGLLPQNLQISSGEILFEHKNLLTLSIRDWLKIRAKEISIIFQDPLSTLNPVLTIGDQLEEVLYYHLGIKGGEAKTRIIEALKEVGIPDPHLRLKAYPHELSGGMRQRVVIAVSILLSPKLLIADEPTTALDPSIQMQIIELLRNLNRERNLSILFITHDLGLLRWFAHRVIVYYRGQIVESAPTESLFTKPLHPYTQLLLNSYPGRKGDALHQKVFSFSNDLFADTQQRAKCYFYERCPLRKDCDPSREPKMISVTETQAVRCLLYECQ